MKMKKKNKLMRILVNYLRITWLKSQEMEKELEVKMILNKIKNKWERMKKKKSKWEEISRDDYLQREYNDDKITKSIILVKWKNRKIMISKI